MSNDKPTFGLQKDTNAAKEERFFDLHDTQWVDLLEIIYICAVNGAAPMLYTSSGGHALCVSIKHGKEGRKYWIGPDDDPGVVIGRICDDWNVGFQDTPISRCLTKEVEKMRVALKSDLSE